MANLKSLAKDTAIYGLSSIVGRFLNYLLVPLYTHYMPKDSGDYGISTNVYVPTMKRPSPTPFSPPPSLLLQRSRLYSCCWSSALSVPSVVPSAMLTILNT